MSKGKRLLFASIAHGGKLLGLIVLVPIIILLICDDEYARTQAREAFVFDLLIAIALIISGLLFVTRFGIVLLIVVLLVSSVVSIIAITSVICSIDYTYPVTGKIARKIK